MTTATQNGPRRGWLGPGLAFPASLVVLAIIMVPILQLSRYSFNRFDPAELMRPPSPSTTTPSSSATPTTATYS